jgi:hypothetical protein
MSRGRKKEREKGKGKEREKGKAGKGARPYNPQR